MSTMRYDHCSERSKIKRVPAIFCIGALSIASADATEELYAEKNMKYERWMSESDLYLNIRSRFESVEQDNGLEDASAMTVRSRLGFKSPQYAGFSFLVEMEDSRIVGEYDDFSVGPTGFNPGEFSVVADPETTEIDQAKVNLNYSVAERPLSLSLGRQLITLADHRFVGHVGWRQDRQTFDAFSLNYSLGEGVDVSYHFIDQRNTIFAKERDVDTSDHLLHINYKQGRHLFSTYGYFLDLNESDSDQHDTFGFKVVGDVSALELPLKYAVEWAHQRTAGTGSRFETQYRALSLSTPIASMARLKLQYEQLGSDDGLEGFSTPLATLHKFNGWADQFIATPDQGLIDVALSLSGKFSGGKWLLAYHDFSSEERLLGNDDLGTELDMSYSLPVAKNYSIGFKYAGYEGGDAIFNKVDTDKFWFWVSASL